MLGRAARASILLAVGASLTSLVLVTGPVGAGATPAPNTTERVSLDPAGGDADNTSQRPVLSADGTTVLFLSFASDLATGQPDPWHVHDLTTGVARKVPVTTDMNQPALTADGGTVVFDSLRSDLVDGDTNGRRDVFALDLATGATTRVSVGSDGAQLEFGTSRAAGVSADGRYAAFVTSTAKAAGCETARVSVRDLATDRTRVVQRCVLDARLSADGSAVVAMSQGRTADCGYELDHVQLRTGVSTPIGCGTDPAVSGDGDVVAYKTKAVDGGIDAIWAFDVPARSQERVDVADDGTPSNGWAGYPAAGPSLSHDGTVVAFASPATNLMPGDWSGTDIFIRDRAAGTTRNATVTADGIPGNGSSFDPSLSADGTLLAFTSAAANLVPPDENLVSDVFVRRLEPSACAAATASVVGTPGDDRLVGTPGRDVIVGLGGDDSVHGRGGDDLLCGGGGADLASYAGSTAPVHVDLGLGTAVGQGTDHLVMVEGVEGSAFNDRLLGSAGPDRLRGLSGFDLVNGLGGDDVMDGGNGNDRLYGRVGRDDLVGGAGDDLLSGGGDRDSLDGGDGTDSCGGDLLDAPVIGCEG